MEELQCPARCSKPGILNRKVQIQIFSTSRRGKTTKKQRCSWYTPSLKRKQGTHSISTCSSSKVFGGSLSATGNSSTPCHFQSQLYREIPDLSRKSIGFGSASKKSLKPLKLSTSRPEFRKDSSTTQSGDDGDVDRECPPHETRETCDLQ